jgi:hypothetical protein
MVTCSAEMASGIKCQIINRIDEQALRVQNFMIFEALIVISPNNLCQSTLSLHLSLII